MSKVPLFSRDEMERICERARRAPIPRVRLKRCKAWHRGKQFRSERDGPTQLKRTPLKKIAKSQRKRLRKYYPLAKEFLSRPENKFCLICTVRREHGENILINLATEIHHWAGRIGKLLCYVPYFRPSCFSCRLWPHDHPKLAREYGLLAPAPLWGVFPVAGKNGD